MRLPTHFVAAVLAGIAGGLAMIVILYGEALWAVGLGVALHAMSVFAATQAAESRRRGTLSEVERDTVFWTATLVPFLGPALAWALPRSCAGEHVENAHEVLERYAGHVQPRIPDYERTLFTGDHDKDLARELDAESFREVLRYGDTLQKRNALRGLAELGKPHHLLLIRDCLVDDDHEVRLYAYGELERLTRTHDSRVAQATARAKESPQDPEARMELAHAHFDLASSGILDPTTAAFHFRAAAANADAAGEITPDDVRSALLSAVAKARRGDVDEADECLQRIPFVHDDRVDVCLARAEVAYLRRDFEAAREQAAQLRATGAYPPDWLSALEPLGGFDEDDPMYASQDEYAMSQPQEAVMPDVDSDDSDDSDHAEESAAVAAESLPDTDLPDSPEETP